MGGQKKKSKFKINIFTAYYVKKNKNKCPSNFVIGDLVLFNITFQIYGCGPTNENSSEKI